MFFTHLSNTNRSNNALQREAAMLLRLKSNLLIHGKDSFLNKLKADIATLNANHPRCTPLALHSWQCGEGAIGVSLGDQFTVGFYLYPVKQI